eukprot:TRINITY_DN1314_c0_g1_i4.p1 TRINITY_DN1314_c0_g1~~TRINITY_DN1314_c0_g1_i4.p1  ORF type:complete len:1439 (-),score=478.97 TRINITY_DN1314_c0_g1_i4:62-4378(-)
MPRAPLKWPGGHRNGHKESVSLQEFAKLQEELQALREDADDAVENLELARVSARTLEEQYRAEESIASRLQLALAASEASLAKQQLASPVLRLEGGGDAGGGDDAAAAREKAVAATAAAEAARISEVAEAAEAARLRKQLVDIREQEQSASASELRDFCAKVAAAKASEEAMALESAARLSEVEQLEAGLQHAEVSSRCSLELQAELCERETAVGELRDELQAVELRCGASEQSVTLLEHELHAQAASSSRIDTLRTELTEEKREGGAHKQSLVHLREELHEVSREREELHASVTRLQTDVAERELMNSKLCMRLEEAGGSSSSSSPRSPRQLSSLKEEISERDGLIQTLHQELKAKQVHSVEEAEVAEEAELCAEEMQKLQKTLTLELMQHESSESELRTSLVSVQSRAKRLEQSFEEHEVLASELQDRLAESKVQEKVAAERRDELEAVEFKASTAEAIKASELEGRVEEQEVLMSALREQLTESEVETKRAAERRDELEETVMNAKLMQASPVADAVKSTQLEHALEEQKTLVSELSEQLTESKAEARTAEERRSELDDTPSSASLAQDVPTDAVKASELEGRVEEQEVLMSALREQLTELEVEAKRAAERRDELEETVMNAKLMQASTVADAVKSTQLEHALEEQKTLVSELREQLTESKAEARTAEERRSELDDTPSSASLAQDVPTDAVKASELEGRVEEQEVLMSALREQLTESEVETKKAAERRDELEETVMNAKLMQASTVADAVKSTQLEHTLEEQQTLVSELREQLTESKAEARTAEERRSELDDTPSSASLAQDVPTDAVKASELEGRVEEQEVLMSALREQLTDLKLEARMATEQSAKQEEAVEANSVQSPSAGIVEASDLGQRVEEHDAFVSELQMQVREFSEEAKAAKEANSRLEAAASKYGYASVAGDLLLEDREKELRALKEEVTMLQGELDSAALQGTAADHSVFSELSEADTCMCLREELRSTQEQRAADAETSAEAVEALGASEKEAAKLLDQLEDMEYALQVTSEAAAEDVGTGSEPVGVREARRLRLECAELQSELSLAETAKKWASSPSSKGRLPRDTAFFGQPNDRMDGEASADMTQRSDTDELSPKAMGLRRQMPSFANQEDFLPIAGRSEEDSKNPFANTENSSETSSDSVSSAPAAMRVVSFEPPPRVHRDEASRNTCPQLKDAAVTDDYLLAKEDPELPPLCGSTPSFSDQHAQAEVARLKAALAEEQAACAAAREEARGAKEALDEAIQIPHFPDPEDASLEPLRAALAEEEAACAAAREEARGAKRALDEAIGGSHGSDVAEAARLRVLLSEEAAKSRRLGTHALRAEEGRRRLLQEIAEDAQVEADLATLAKVVSRTAKAISVISKEAKVPPVSSLPTLPALSTASKSLVSAEQQLASASRLRPLPAAPQANSTVATVADVDEFDLA